MNATRHQCPICTWAHTEPALPMYYSPDSLAALFKIGHAGFHDVIAREQRIEKALRDHLEQHTVLEWVKAVTEAQARAKLMEERALAAIDKPFTIRELS